MNFFYRFEAMQLLPGNKTAGFELVIESEAFIKLSRIPFAAQRQQQLLEDARERVLRAQLLTKRMASGLALGFHADTACPRFFVVDRMFGGSIGTDPEIFSWLARDSALDYLGPEVRFTPHNVDTPKQALALMLLAQTWAETAGDLLSLRTRAAA